MSFWDPFKKWRAWHNRRAHGRPLGYAPDAPGHGRRRGEPGRGRGFGREESGEGGHDEISLAIEDLVERSRLGEQNAMAHLLILDEQKGLIDRGAYPGDPESRATVLRSHATKQRYEREHPPGDDCNVCLHSSPADPKRLAAADDGNDASAAFGYERHSRGRREGRGSRDGRMERRFRRMDERLRPALPPPLPEEAAAGLAGISSFGCDESPASAGNACTILLALPDAGGLDGVLGAVVLLALGPELGRGRLTAARDAVSDPRGRQAFEASARDPFAPPRDEFGFAGFAFGQAKLLQAVQRQGAPPEILHPDMAWELGG